MSDLPVLANRALWLFGVPVTCSFTFWMALSSPLPPGCGYLPLAGLLSVLGYRLLGSTPVHLWPYAPYALVTVGFVVMFFAPGTSLSLENYIIGLYYGLILMPLLAIAGSFVAFIAVGTRYGGLRA